MYKIKLQPGDYCRRDMGEDKYCEVAQRFFDDGCPRQSELCISDDAEWYFGWSERYNQFYYGSFSAKAGSKHFTGRELTYDEVMEKETMSNEWYEKGELPPIGTECEITHDGHYGVWRGVEFLKFEIGGHEPRAAVKHLYGLDDNFTHGCLYWVYGVTDKDFACRPIKSERDKAIEEIYEVILSVTETFAAAEAIYDAGYRKVK